MKSSSICSAVPEGRLVGGLALGLGLSLFLGLFLAVLPSEAARKGKGKNKRYEPQELIQPFLGPQYAQWLIGPIARIADDDEIQAYLILDDDTEAEAFIEEFWRRRDPSPAVASNPLRRQFDERAAEADRRFSETAYRGRYTDRGTVFILYGEPEETDYDVSPYPDGPPLVLWKYPRSAEPGLDGDKPDRTYRFIKEGDLTVFYDGRRRPIRPQFRPGPP